MSIRVLLIEDSKNQRDLLYKVLSRLPKVEPYPAEDGLEAYALLRALGHVDMILMDHNMPYVKGLDFIKKVKSTPCLKEIPIVVSSFETETQQFLDAGAQEVFVKPYDINKLSSVIAKLSKS